MPNESAPLRVKDSLASAYKRRCASKRRRSDTRKPGKCDEEVCGCLFKFLWRQNNDSFTTLNKMYPNKPTKLFQPLSNDGDNDSMILSVIAIHFSDNILNSTIRRAFDIVNME